YCRCTGRPEYAPGRTSGYWGPDCTASGCNCRLVCWRSLCRKQFAMRVTLCIKHLAPLDYVHFLDYRAERLFLRKVGGGYIFIHRMVMEYFASLSEGESGRLN